MVLYLPDEELPYTGITLVTLWSSICMRICWLSANFPHDNNHTSSSFRLVSMATTAWASLAADCAPSKRGGREERRERRASTLGGRDEDKMARVTNVKIRPGVHELLKAVKEQSVCNVSCSNIET